MTEKRIRCSICNSRIDIEPVSGWTKGHNAWPVNNGRCCADCNEIHVIPIRLANMMRKEKLRLVE